MNLLSSQQKPGAAGGRRGVKQPGGPRLTQDVDRPAQRQAAAILEVLAGARTPQQAAEALAVSLPRYYQLESRALRGLVQACQSRPKGRVRSPASELATLQRENARLQRELGRQQTLVRAAQRSVGLPPPPPPARTAAKRRRQPVVRALSVARRLQQEATPAPAAPPLP
jgi:sugar-specific transcriptional regulator TrmB